MKIFKLTLYLLAALGCAACSPFHEIMQEEHTSRLGNRCCSMAECPNGFKMPSLVSGRIGDLNVSPSWVTGMLVICAMKVVADIPYDGKLTKEDSKGKWWGGYDPREVYVQNHLWSVGMGNGASISTGEYYQNSFDCTADMINKYDLDLL